jgi:hypothetical protein
MPRSKPGGPSSTQDSLSHHTSPNKADKSNVIISQPTSRPITGKLYNPKLPDHVVKHPRPVGRPRNGDRGSY